MDEFDIDGLEGIEEAERRAQETAESVDDVYQERQGDNDCGGACSI